MGDIFDSRKSIDYQSLEWSKKLSLNHEESIRYMQLSVIMIVTTKIQIY